MALRSPSLPSECLCHASFLTGCVERSGKCRRPHGRAGIPGCQSAARSTGTARCRPAWAGNLAARFVRSTAAPAGSPASDRFAALGAVRANAERRVSAIGQDRPACGMLVGSRHSELDCRSGRRAPTLAMPPPRATGTWRRILRLLRDVVMQSQPVLESVLTYPQCGFAAHETSEALRWARR